jgi:hypothetical protein
LSARLNRYYGRLRRPPGSPPTSRCRPVIGRDAPAALRRLPGRGGPPQFPPSPSERSAPHTPGSPSRLHSRLFTASMAFTLISGARHSLSPTQRAGPLTTRQASRDATDRSVASPTGLLTLGFDPARFQTEPPACYRASWQLPGLDSHRQATTSLSLDPATSPPTDWAHEKPRLIGLSSQEAHPAVQC